MIVAIPMIKLRPDNYVLIVAASSHLAQSITTVLVLILLLNNID